MKIHFQANPCNGSIILIQSFKDAKVELSKSIPNGFKRGFSQEIKGHIQNHDPYMS